MLRRPVLLALPAILSVAGATALLTADRNDAAAPAATLAVGTNVQAAAPASAVDAGSAVQAMVPAARPGTRSRVIKDVLPSSVRIAVAVDGKPLRVASGVIVGFGKGADGGKVGYVMTNTHVVESRDPDKTTIEVLVDRKGKTREFSSRVIAKGEVPDMDLALLEVPNLEGRAAELVDDGDLDLGDDVVAVGAPFGRGISISSGIVSQLEWDDEGAARAFKTDAPIGYGASGGGIFRVPDGKLLAVIEGYRTAKVSFPMAERSYSFDVPMPGETFAAPAAKVRSFLKEKGVAHLLAGLFPGETAEELAPTRTAAR
jgi:serine protease Do